MTTPAAPSGGGAATARCVAAALLVLSTAATAEDIPPPPPLSEEPARRAADAPPPSPGARECRDCGVVRSIRGVERERPNRRGVPTYMTSDQYLEGRRYSEPMVGPVFGMTFGKGQETKGFVGAAGSETMRQRILEVYYEVSVRFDDGRYGVFEQENLAGLRVGDRVQVANHKVGPAPK